MLNYADRANGYLAYVGQNWTSMNQIKQTSGELNLYFKPGEQVLLFVSCRKSAAEQANLGTPYFVFYTKTSYLAPPIYDQYVYTLPNGWADKSSSV